jgi:hypothetical protein
VLRTAGYEMIEKLAQSKEFGDGKARNCYDSSQSGRRIKHPARYLVGAAMRLPNQIMVNTTMFMVAGNQNRLADQRMKRIGHDGFKCQNTCIMAPAPTMEPRTGPSSPR